jgi:hypothetical protein
VDFLFSGEAPWERRSQSKKENLKSKLQIPIFFEAELVRSFGRKQKNTQIVKRCGFSIFRRGAMGKAQPIFLSVQ